MTDPIGARIRAARQERGWTQAQLAERINVHQTAIARIESGKRAIRLHEAYALAGLLGIKSTDFLPDATSVAAEAPGIFRLKIDITGPDPEILARITSMVREEADASRMPARLTDEQLTAAIMRAIPIDHDDHSTLVRVHEGSTTWGRPEWLAAEILASIRSAEMEASE